ncbi:hypothetical protein X732_32335 [Mesorhizobium sp. L2C066B000]|nr:hypothetical protein X732_32335 [Mesorhizobium sp. L2C066B000]
MLSIDTLLPSAHASLRTTDLELFENGSHQRLIIASGMFRPARISPIESVWGTFMLRPT